MTRAGLSALGRAAGAGGTFVVRQALFGSRHDTALGADVRSSRKPAAGAGKRSVFNGPRQAYAPGAPLLLQW